MVSVNECLIDMIAYVDIMIDNGYYKYRGIKRRTSSGLVYLSTDIDNLKTVAIECISKIDVQLKLK